MTLVWGIRREGTPDELKRAKWLFEFLDAEKAQIIIPTVVVSEYLTPVDESRHLSVISTLNDRFIISPFDILSSSLAAKLFTLGKPLRKGGEPGGRACLRADTMIIATAKTHGAHTLYSGDAECRELAQKVMRSEDLPEKPVDLFGYLD